MVEEECGQDGIEHQKRQTPADSWAAGTGREGTQCPRYSNAQPFTPSFRNTLEPFTEKKNQGRSNLDQGVRGGVKQDGDTVGLQEQKIEICFMLVGPSRRLKTQSDLVEDKTERLRMPGPQPF